MENKKLGTLEERKQSMIHHVVDYLEPIKDEWEKRFTWDNKLKKLPHTLGVEIKGENPAKEYLQLRKEFSKILTENSSTHKEAYKWIINVWGKIKLGKEPELHELAKEFLEGNTKFDRVSSTSKIAAFTKPKDYVIYDSRIAYALNWIMFYKNAGIFFPSPESRNQNVTGFDIKTIIRLRYAEKYKEQCNNEEFVSKVDKELFISEKDAYKELRELLMTVGRKLFPNDENGHVYTEMLLFSIAVNTVLKELLDEVKITTK